MQTIAIKMASFPFLFPFSSSAGRSSLLKAWTSEEPALGSMCNRSDRENISDIHSVYSLTHSVIHFPDICWAPAYWAPMCQPCARCCEYRNSPGRFGHCSCGAFKLVKKKKTLGILSLINVAKGKVQCILRTLWFPRSMEKKKKNTDSGPHNNPTQIWKQADSILLSCSPDSDHCLPPMQVPDATMKSDVSR